RPRTAGPRSARPGTGNLRRPETRGSAASAKAVTFGRRKIAARPAGSQRTAAQAATGARAPERAAMAEAEQGRARAASAEAARAGDDRALTRILGDTALPLIRTSDPAEDRASRERFADAYAQKAEILRPSEDRATLQVGNDGWPLPIPMVRSGRQWRFDA